MQCAQARRPQLQGPEARQAVVTALCDRGVPILFPANSTASSRQCNNDGSAEPRARLQPFAQALPCRGHLQL